MLAGEQTLDEIVLNSWDRYIDDHITLHAGKKVVEVHRVKRIVRANDGTEAEHDRLSAPAAIAIGPEMRHQLRLGSAAVEKDGAGNAANDT